MRESLLNTNNKKPSNMSHNRKLNMLPKPKSTMSQLRRESKTITLLNTKSNMSHKSDKKELLRMLLKPEPMLNTNQWKEDTPKT